MNVGFIFIDSSECEQTPTTKPIPSNSLESEGNPQLPPDSIAKPKLEGNYENDFSKRCRNNKNLVNTSIYIRYVCVVLFVNHSKSSDTEEHDPIVEKFEMIIQDITVYYTKKLDLLRIKSEQHQVT